MFFLISVIYCYIFNYYGIIEFIDHPSSDSLKKDILETAEKQRKFKSEHKYDLEKFGLSEQQIIKDCTPIYDTFLNSQ